MPYKDPLVKAAYHREYKRRNRWRYRVREQAYDSATHANERARKYGADGVVSVEEVLDIFADGSCHYCGSVELLGLDHVIPLNSGGLNRPSNIVLACRSCNASKWRGDKPWRWSRKHDRCVECGKSDRPHRCHGLCEPCYSRRHWHVRRGAATWPS